MYWNKKIISLFLISALLSGCVRTAAEKEPAKVSPQKTVKTPTKKTNPTDNIKTDVLYMEALREQDPVKRKAKFKKVWKRLNKEAKDPKNLKANLLLGYMADFGHGVPQDTIKAAKHYRIAADGGLPEAKTALAEFWLRNHIFLDDAAQQLLNIPNYQKNPSVLCTLGTIYYEQDKREEGFKYLEMAYRQSKQIPPLRMQVLKIIHNAFEASYKTGNYDAAFLELKREEQLDSSNALTSYFMGVVELCRNKKAVAEKYFEIALERNPGAAYIYRELAFLKAKSGRYDDAVDDMKIAFAVSGKKPAYLRDLIEIYIMTRKTDQLLKLCNKLLETNPDNTAIRSLRVPLLMLQKQYQEAYDDLQIISRNPKMAKNPDTLEALAASATYLGKKEDAVKAYEELLKHGYNPVTVLNLAEMYIICDQYDKALNLLKNEKQKQHKDLLVRCITSYLQACALLASGKDAAAEIQDFQKDLPAYRKKYREENVWDVTMFKGWLTKAKIPEQSRKKIEEMTSQISNTALPRDKKDNTK